LKYIDTLNRRAFSHHTLRIFLGIYPAFPHLIRFVWWKNSSPLVILLFVKQGPKMQLLVNLKSEEIVRLAFANREKHGFRRIKESCIHVPVEIETYETAHRFRSCSFFVLLFCGR